MASTTVKRGDLFPDVEHTILDEDGNPVSVEGAAVVFRLRHSRGREVVLTDQDAEIVDGAAGQVAYRWKGTETDIEPGTYEGVFRVTPAGGGGDPYTAPTEGVVIVYIEDNLL